jgi:hypothetical protein
LVHPDHNPGVEEANLVLAALNILHEDAERKIADGTFGKSLATVTFKDRKTNRTIEELEPLTRGDIADLYTGRLDGKKVVLKIASDAGDSDLIKNEATVLRKLAEAPDADHFMKYLPKLIAGGDTTWDQGLCTGSTNEPCSGLTTEGQRHRLALWLDVYDLRQCVVMYGPLAVCPSHLLRRNDLPCEGDFAQTVTDVRTSVLCNLLFAFAAIQLLGEEII